MISPYLQLYTWFFLFIIGAAYYIVLNVFFFFSYKFKIVFRLFLYTLFVIFISSLIIILLFIFNGGIIHYTYALFFLLGYYVAKRVKVNVKRHKLSIFSKKQ